MRRAALLGALVVLLVGALVVVRPFLAAKRDFAASVPSPAALSATSTVPLEPGTATCFRNAAIETHSQEVRFNVASPEGPAPAIAVRIRGDGYEFTGEVPPGTLDTQQVRLAVPPAPRDLPVKVCFRVAESVDVPLGLYASADRTRSRSVARVGGRRTEQSVWFSFHEGAPRTIAERLSATAQRIAVFRPGYVTPVVVWALFALLLCGVPAAVVWAYVRAVGEDERAAPRELDVTRRRSWWRRLSG